jgi:hypothetical protein
MTRPHFDDLNRRYAETDWVSEYQRLWAIFNHWFVAHIGNSQDRHCIEALKAFPETTGWVTRIIDESKIKRPQRVSDGLDGSHPRFASNNVISRLFRETMNSPIIEPRINYPWRAGIDNRVRITNAISLDEDMFIKGYRAHGVMLQENITFNLTFHQTLELIGIHATGCCFYRDTPSTLESQHCAIQMVDKFRAIPDLAKVVSLFESSGITTLPQDTIEMLYKVRNTAMHGSLDFLVEADNTAAKAASEALDSLIQDIRDNW